MAGSTKSSVLVDAIHVAENSALSPDDDRISFN
jgi:hypothetical protein